MSIIKSLRLGFSVNSSSDHSCVFIPKGEKWNDSLIDSQYFGWDNFTLVSPQSKLKYLAANLYDVLVSKIGRDGAQAITESWTGIKIEKDSAGVDHQSVMHFPFDWEEKCIDKAFFDDFKNYILRDDIAIIGGNDNDESNGLSQNDPALLDSLRHGWVARQENNYWILFNRKNGTKLRMSFDGNLKPRNLIKPYAPELVDLKITSFCSMGCHFCYQGSTPQGKHANLETINDLIYSLATLRVFELACLHGDTITFGPQGAVKIKDINIGHLLYDSNGKESKVVNINKNTKKCINLICNKGLKIICTKDHPFIVDNKIILAKDMLGKKFDLSKDLYTEEISEIDMSKFITNSTRIKGKRGGNIGGKIDGNLCRLNQSCVWINKKIILTSDLMWLYGLVVAEGFKKGIALHKKEIDIANKAIRIYKNTFGIGGSVRTSGENGITVEFSNPSIFETFFFKALKIGYGARNKSINFLNKVNNELCLSAIEGMFEGDGCDRVRNQFNISTFMSSYKTASLILANELAYLLKTRFDAFSSVYEGINKKRFIGERELPVTKYYQIEIYGKNNLEKVFNNYNSSKEYKQCLTSKYSANKGDNFIVVKDIKEIGNQKVYDITLDNNSNHIFTLQYGIKTHNCGGGEPTSHPQFIDILKMCKDRLIVPNFTTKSVDWLSDDKMLDAVNNFAGSFAYSVQSLKEAKDFNDRAEELVARKYSFNYVLGTASQDELNKILNYCFDNCISINILGFKNGGRSQKFKQHDNSKWIDNVLKLSKSKYAKIGIDTLTSKNFEKQLKEKGVSDIFYDTEDGKFSCYIDVVNGLIGPSSYGKLEVLYNDGIKISNSIIKYFNKY